MGEGKRFQFEPEGLLVELLRHEGRDRAVRIPPEFGFTWWDSRGVPWRVGAGRIADGASIPRWLWAVAGPPLVGDYRRASIVHDIACQDKQAGLLTDVSWRDVHYYTFYEPCVYDGMAEWRAGTYYAGVRLGGPAAWRDALRGLRWG